MKFVYYVLVTYKCPVKDLSRFKDLFHNLIVIDNTNNNLGYSGGANVGIHQAMGKSADWTVILNQDLGLSTKGMDSLEKALENAPPGIVGPFCGGLDEKRWTTMLPSKKADYISGACFAIHRDVIKKIGMFYEPYFMYYEDVDYCIRAKKAGFPLIPCADKEVSHADNPSLGKSSYLLEYYLARNHLLFTERQAPLSVKAYEFARLPLTIKEYKDKNSTGALDGIRDYFLRKFGERKI